MAAMLDARGPNQQFPAGNTPKPRQMTNPTMPTKPFAVGRDDAPAALKGAVVAVGNFDGVHRGHRAVIAAAQKRAAALGKPAAALTFTPHPRVFLRPQEPHFALNDERSKLRLLAATGLDGAIVMTFNAGLAATSAEDFVGKILRGRFAISGAAIGFDFHFGKNRAGSPEFLREQGAQLGFAVDIVPPLEDEGRPVSSGAVRNALTQGKVVEAAELLGAPWFVSAEVIAGAKRGRELGFPTANLKLDPSCALKHGIYAVRVAVPHSAHSRASGNPETEDASLSGSPLSRGRAERFYDGVASFGRRPTFDNGAPLLEVFLFDFNGDLYGQRIDVALISWIRAEAKFDSIDALRRQMDDDSAKAREALARAPNAFPVLGEI
jgi:riboflavin kinase/FMN adenylyltransferase